MYHLKNLGRLGLPANSGTSYRPISLLCPAVNVLERLLRPELVLLPLSSTQYGFRLNHFIVSALLPLAHRIACGFNEFCPPHHTLIMAIDFSKLFDMVNHTKLISTVILSSLSNNTNHWLFGYLNSGQPAFDTISLSPPPARTE